MGLFGLKKNKVEEEIVEDTWHVPTDEEWEVMKQEVAEKVERELAEEEANKLSNRLAAGLAKTRDNFVRNMDYVFGGFSNIDDEFYEELEEILITGDLGVRTTEMILDNLRDEVKSRRISDPMECRDVLVEQIRQALDLGEISYDFENQTSVVFVVGVNGVGKTTTIGKLSAKLVLAGKNVVIAAADTFRAAARDQLAAWAERSGATLIGGNEGSDPASVVYDAIAAARARKADVLLIDTAGRLHNKKNLMDELAKMNRIIDREYPGAIKETLIVLDATTGQNAVNQAREFKEVSDVSGAVLTKMDGSAKGGICVAITSELGIPIKYIGVGEQIDDLQKFDSDAFVSALFAKEGNDTEGEKDA